MLLGWNSHTGLEFDISFPQAFLASKTSQSVTSAELLFPCLHLALEGLSEVTKMSQCLHFRNTPKTLPSMCRSLHVTQPHKECICHPRYSGVLCFYSSRMRDGTSSSGSSGS